MFRSCEPEDRVASSSSAINLCLCSLLYGLLAAFYDYICTFVQSDIMKAWNALRERLGRSSVFHFGTLWWIPSCWPWIQFTWHGQHIASSYGSTDAPDNRLLSCLQAREDQANKVCLEVIKRKSLFSRSHNNPFRIIRKVRENCCDDNY